MHTAGESPPHIALHLADCLTVCQSPLIRNKTNKCVCISLYLVALKTSDQKPWKPGACRPGVLLLRSLGWSPIGWCIRSRRQVA